MSSHNINFLLDCVFEEAEKLLINDFNIEIMKVNQLENYVLEKNISSIKLIGSQNFMIIFSCHDKLLVTILKQFLPEGVDNNEKKEILDDLLNEVVNTIVGLSIQKFISKYKALELDIPLKLSKKEAVEILKKLDSQYLQIETSLGNVSFTIVELRQ